MTPPTSSSNNRVPTLALTALALVYPLATVRYFWEDWFKFYHQGTQVIRSAAGLVIPAIGGQYTLLSPWRLAHAALAAGLLFSSARRLRQGKPEARAFANIALLGVVLPQVLWYGELSMDWFQGRNLETLMLGGLAAVALPAATLGKRERVLEGWGASGPLQGRVMSASVLLGWFGFWSSYFLENILPFRGIGGTIAAAMATIALSMAGAIGLYRQRAWGVLAAMGSAGMMAVSLGSLAGGRGLASTLGAITSSPFTMAVLAMPMLVMGAVLAPFLKGFARKLAGVEPTASASYHEAIAAAGGVRVQVPASSAAPAATQTEPTSAEDDALLAEIEASSPGGTRGERR